MAASLRLIYSYVFIAMFIRFLILVNVIAALILASGRDTGWQTGTLRIENSYIDGWNSYGVSAARRTPGGASPDPMMGWVSFDIISPSGTYRASVQGIAADSRVTMDELFPWLRDMPAAVQFCVKGKVLYLIDTKNRVHKAEILPPPKAPSSRRADRR